VDTIVHLAGVVNAVSQREYAEVNVEGTRAVVKAAQAVNARLVHISSLSVAGPASAAAPSTEDTPPNPMTPYGRSKLASEHVVRSAVGLRWTILRPAIVYGPGDIAVAHGPDESVPLDQLEGARAAFVEMFRGSV